MPIQPQGGDVLHDSAVLIPADADAAQAVVPIHAESDLAVFLPKDSLPEIGAMRQIAVWPVHDDQPTLRIKTIGEVRRRFAAGGTFQQPPAVGAAYHHVIDGAGAVPATMQDTAASGVLPCGCLLPQGAVQGGKGIVILRKELVDLLINALIGQGASPPDGISIPVICVRRKAFFLRVVAHFSGM